jgi:hypothetical protein
MKTVLVIGSDFTPSSMPPALRIRFFVRHLPEFGWKPIVLTADPSHYEQPVDPENERLLPSDLEVITTPALPVALTRKIGIGDIGMRTLWHHWRAIKSLRRTRKIDLIFIPVPPSIPMVLGRMAFDRFRVPYVVDYIDPWVSDYYFTVPKAQRPKKWIYIHWMSKKLEPFALRHVGHITGVSKGTTDSVIARYEWLKENDATEIPYGGEPDDFDYLRRNPRINRFFDSNDGCIHLVYVGACIPAMHGALRAVFQALNDGLRSAPAIFSRLRLHFVGTTYAANAADAHQVLPIAREYGLLDLVQESPARAPYLDALQLLFDADAALVLGSDQPHYTASKIFPYILAEKPLLAIFHEQSTVVRILSETGGGRALTFSAERWAGDLTGSIREWLARLVTDPQSLRPRTNWAAFDRYNTRAMSARLAAAFEKALGNRSSVAMEAHAVSRTG